MRKIQNILPIDAPALNSLIKQVKKVEYELVTLLRDIPKEEKKEEAKPKLLHMTPNLKFGLKSYRNGKFLHVANENHANGVGIHGWEGFGNKNSVWEFVVDKDDSKAVVGIRNVATKFLLNIWAGVKTDGAPVKLHEVAEHTDSKFILHYKEQNIVNIEGLGPRRYLCTDQSSNNGCRIAICG